MTQNPVHMPLPGAPALLSLVTASALLPHLSERVWTIAPAERPTCQAFLVTDGTARYAQTDGPTIELAAPALLWLPRSARGRVRLEAGAGGFTCSAPEDAVRRAVGAGFALGGVGSVPERLIVASGERLVASADRLAATFAALAEEAREGRPDSNAMMSHHLGLLLLHLQRAALIGAPSGLRVPGATTVQRFRQLIELHYRETLTIGAFARLLGVTPSHLHDACLRATGRTPLTLIHERVIAEARLRLEQTDLPVEQVGYSLGFRDAGYFNRFFKRLTGRPPGQHRRAAAGLPTATDPGSFAAWP